MEDPPENLFTENVVFFHGNYITFPGIASHPADIFLNLSQGIFNSGVNLPKDFTDSVYHGISLILALGNKVAIKAGLTGNMEGVKSEKNIQLADNIVDFSISQKELEQLCTELHIDIQTINDFIFQDTISSNMENQEMHPLLFYPVILHEGRYYFLLISNQLNTINEYILRTASKFGCQETLLAGYRDELWGHVGVALAELGWRETDIVLQAFSSNNTPKESVYNFDQGKLAYLMLETPLKIPDIFTNSGSEAHPPDIGKRMRLVAKDLLSRENLSNHELLSIQLVDSCGRNRLIRYEIPQENEFRLLFNVHDFINLSKGENWNSHSLWKFAKALAKFQSKTQSTAGTVELYSLYKQKSSGFYFSDDAVPDYIAILPGEGSDLIRDSKVKQDYHASAYVYKGSFGYLPVVSSGDFAPIFRPIIHIGYFIESLEIFRWPIWFTNHEVSNGSMADTVRLYSNAISFWLHSMESALMDVLNPVLQWPLEIMLELDPMIFASMTSEELSQLPKKEYSASFVNGILTFKIPGSSMWTFTGGDNIGERELMRHLLQSFR
ncbi:MAG: hypothetical protein WAM46_05145, partial [Flavobacterium sp.]